MNLGSLVKHLLDFDRVDLLHVCLIFMLFPSSDDLLYFRLVFEQYRVVMLLVFRSTHLVLYFLELHFPLIGLFES